MEGGIAAMTTVEEGLYDVCVYIMGFSFGLGHGWHYERPGVLV